MVFLHFLLEKFQNLNVLANYSEIVFLQKVVNDFLLVFVDDYKKFLEQLVLQFLLVVIQTVQTD